MTSDFKELNLIMTTIATINYSNRKHINRLTITTVKRRYGRCIAASLVKELFCS